MPDELHVDPREQVLPVLEHLSSTTPRSSAELQALRALAEQVKCFAEGSPPPAPSSLTRALSADFEKIPGLKDLLELPPLAGRARTHMHVHRLDAEAINAAYRSPDATWSNPERPETTIRAKNSVALVVDTEGVVQLILPADQAYERRRAAGRRDEGHRRPAAGGGKYQAFDTVKEFLQHAQARGFEYESGKEHGRLTHPEYPGKSVSYPLTPSDHRWWLNLSSQIRKEFGIDLR